MLILEVRSIEDNNNNSNGNNGTDRENQNDFGFSQVRPTRRFNQVRKQGCSTIICGIIILIIVIFKLRGISFKDATDRWIDYDDTEVQSTAEIKVFPTQDSYTATLNCNGYVYLINCADNLDEEAVQQTIGDRDPEALFLISDATKFANIEANKVYVTSKFYGDYYSNGEFFEDEIGLPNGKVELQLKNDVLRVHYVKNGDRHSYGHSNGQANGWYSNGQRNRTSGYPWCNQTRSTENRSNRYYSGNNYNDRTRQRYGYGYRMSGFSKALVSIGVAAGTLLKATGTLAKKSFNKAKDYTDSVKANRKEREENIYYTEDAEFEDVSFNQEDMMEILDIPANSLMCATESGVHLAKKITESL